MLQLFLLSSLFASSFAATECVGTDNQQGPPLTPGTCPGGLVFTDDEQCCLLAGVQIVGGASTTLAPGATTSFNGINFGSTAGIGVGGIGVTASGNCMDLLNPRTGVSDCPARRSYCQDPTYFDVMTVQCPRTCNRCSSVTNRGNTVAGGAGGCVDLINPRTGTSDCPQRASLCNDANYAQLMRVQCPRTCGRCTGTGAGATVFGGFTSINGIMITTTPSSFNGNCADQVNPNTRISDCPSLRSFCTNSVYRDLMRIQCPATCGFCGSNQNNLNVNGIQFG